MQDIKQLPEQMRPPQDLRPGAGPKGAEPSGSFAASAVPKQQPKKEAPPEGLQ